ncbi:MAG: hypothetical protein PVF58_11770 [Candidatus Methanofastidiosia archaeon]|jgi:hypothetical protein
MKPEYAIIGIVILVMASCISQSPHLKFSAGPCDKSIDPRQEDMGVKDTHWVEETTLVVTVMVGLNCAEEIEGGDYYIIGDTITLKYTSPQCDVCATCECAHELTYTFTNIKKKEYTFKLERILKTE